MGKAAVVGMRDRVSGKMAAKVIEDTSAPSVIRIFPNEASVLRLVGTGGVAREVDQRSPLFRHGGILELEATSGSLPRPSGARSGRFEQHKTKLTDGEFTALLGLDWPSREMEAWRARKRV